MTWPWCIHKWKLVSYSVEPGMEKVWAEKASRETIDKLIETTRDRTHLYLRCAKCGDVAARTLPGILSQQRFDELQAAEG